MKYSVMTLAEAEETARLYMEYYNTCEEGCWTYEKAYKRIHQMITIEDSLCLIQKNEAGEITGFAIGYFREYDDLTAYELEEIVILADFQNKGYGKQFLHEIERRLLEKGAAHLGLTSVNDEKHRHFYKSFGMYEAKNLLLMGKHYGE